MKSWCRVMLLSVLLSAVTAGAALAQTPPIEEFVPLAPGELLEGQEQIPAPRLVFAAYTIVWLVFFVYLLSLWRRLGRVEAELRAVTDKLEQTGR